MKDIILLHIAGSVRAGMLMLFKSVDKIFISYNTFERKLLYKFHGRSISGNYNIF